MAREDCRDLDDRALREALSRVTAERDTSKQLLIEVLRLLTPAQYDQLQAALRDLDLQGGFFDDVRRSYRKRGPSASGR